jgi:CheY-like chemotaxis protein
VSAGKETRRTGQGPQATGYRVLIVDDERPVLELIDEVLHVNGFETLAVASPVEALKKARIQKFDALVLDLYMPEMSGMLFHAKLKVIDAELASRTVFISGYIAKEELRNHLSGNPTFLEKPFKTDDLVTMVRSVLPPVPRQVSTRPSAPRTPSVERS